MPPMAVGRIGPACSVFPNDEGEDLIYAARRIDPSGGMVETWDLAMILWRFGGISWGFDGHFM